MKWDAPHFRYRTHTRECKVRLSVAKVLHKGTSRSVTLHTPYGSYCDVRACVNPITALCCGAAGALNDMNMSMRPSAPRSAGDSRTE